MSFNITSEVFQISLKNIIASYMLYDHPLRNVNEARYLGVIIDSKLNFNKQTDSVCKKANTTLAFSCIYANMKLNLMPMYVQY